MYIYQACHQKPILGVQKKRFRASAIRMEAFSWRDSEEMCHANHGLKPCDKQEALENVTVFAAMLHPMNDCARLVQANQPHFSAAITLCVCVCVTHGENNLD